MKEHYVSYEQSQALKRLGFDWDVRGYYTRDDNLKKVREGTALNHNDTKKFKNILSAPRLDQAAAWMREVKEIDIEPRVWFVGNKREYRPYVMPPKCKDYIAYPPEDSYEKALESGISMALELLGKEVKE